MSPLMERACMAAVGLVPISFDQPPPDATCAGKRRVSLPMMFGLCMRCSRYGASGIEPAARIVAGSTECINFRETV